MIEWNNRFLIGGVSGTGKTYCSLWILKEYVRKQKRTFFVFLSDNSRDYNKSNHPPGMRPKTLGFKLLRFDERKAKRTWNWVSVLRKNPKLYIETENILQEESTKLVNDLSRALWSLGSALFVVDEAWSFLPHREHPEEFERMVRGGRKKGIDVMVVTHRVVDIHPRILNSLNTIVSFRLTERNDLERINQYFEADVRKKIPKLRQGQYLIRLTETGDEEQNTTMGLK